MLINISCGYFKFGHVYHMGGKENILWGEKEDVQRI